MVARRVALLAALFAAPAAAEDVAPVHPKNIDISLSARWPASPAAVEAAEFMAEEDALLFWRFAEGMSKESSAPKHVRSGEGTDRERYDHVLTVASELLSPLGLKVLKAFLAAHVLSPRAEMWRQLAEDETRQYDVSADATAWLRSCGRAIALDAAKPDVAAITALIETVTGSAECAVPVRGARSRHHRSTHPRPRRRPRPRPRPRPPRACLLQAKAEDRAVSDNAPLSRDHVHGSPAEGAPMVVLYAPLGSAAFAAAHALLQAQSAAGVITYVFRPLWLATAADARQTLQGYGVQLAIK